MNKSLFVIYSQGGTTTRVAESIASGLRSADWSVDFFNLKDKNPPDLKGYDLLAIGSPTYYFRPPFKVMEYVDGLPALNGLPSAVFVLKGSIIGDAGNYIRRGLARKGARDAGYFHSFGEDYFFGYIRQGYLLSQDHPTPAELAQAEQFGQAVADRVAAKEYTPAPEDPPAPAMYRLERFLTHRWLVEQVYSQMFRVDADLCTGCGLCIGNCPTNNLSEGEDGCPTWGHECLLCLYCEMQCPEDAITSPVSLPVFLPIMRYNLSHASRDKSIDHVKVKHSQGRTTRL